MTSYLELRTKFFYLFFYYNYDKGLFNMKLLNNYLLKH